MTIWVDADGCPARVRKIVEKASLRTGISVVFVADRALPIDEGETLSSVQVEKGDNRADDYIREHGEEGDIAISRDVHLAADLVAKGILVIDDRGGLYTEENIRERVSLRDRMMEFREMGLNPESGTGKAGEREVRIFAEVFDRELTRRMKEVGGEEGTSG